MGRKAARRRRAKARSAGRRPAGAQRPLTAAAAEPVVAGDAVAVEDIVADEAVAVEDVVADEAVAVEDLAAHDAVAEDARAGTAEPAEPVAGELALADLAGTRPAAARPQPPQGSRRRGAIAAARRSPRRVLAAAVVLVAVVAVVLVRAQGGQEGGLQLHVGDVARMAPDANVTAGEAATGTPAGRTAAAVSPPDPRPRRRAHGSGRASAATTPTATPAGSSTGPAPTATPGVRVVGRAGPPQQGRPLPTAGDATPDPAPPAKARITPAATPAATPAPARTPAPRTYAVDRTDVRMSPLNGTGPVERAIERYRPLPSPARPYATYLGRIAGTGGAAFVVTPGTSVLGGDCRPSRRQCAVVTVPAGRHAWIGFSDGMAWRLDVLATDQVAVPSRAAARAARARFSPAGACVLSRLHVLPGSLRDLGVRLQVPLSAGELGCPAG